VNWNHAVDKVAPLQTGSYPALGFDPHPEPWPRSPTSPRNGQMVGTKGLNMLGRIGGGSLAVDPLSGLGRGIDAGIGGAKIVGGQVYQQLTDDKGNPPAPAAQTFSGRLAGRAAS
jgi:hypothetical protein